MIELLVVVAMIAILSALLTPAVLGMLGVTGPRGGVNTVAGALEQARLSALESGVSSYLAWAPETAGTASSAVIVFREKKEGETADLIPVTRWLKLPQGVYLEPVGSFTSVSPGNALPGLDGRIFSSVVVVKFDRFGRLLLPSAPAVFKIGAKAVTGGEFLGGADNYFELTVQPLTGRTSVADKALRK